MLKLEVNAPSKNYPIYIDNSFENLVEVINELKLNSSSACVITDSNVEHIYLEEIVNKLETVFDKVFSCSFAAGEKNKNIETLQSIYKYFLDTNMDRNSVVIALGGGVVGDIAGFAASTYMRGISYIQIPTTLLSQVDSSVGGKTGINFSGVKNPVGCFHQPELVFINTETLKTSPPEHLGAGMAEVLKYAYIRDKDYLNYILENKDSILKLEFETMRNIVYKACEHKASIVNLDEKEKNLRAILNFGHTFGHALESLSQLVLPHGFAVSLGMSSALYLSNMYEYITEEELTEAENNIVAFGLPTRITKNEIITAENVFNRMQSDKKTVNGELNIVLLKSIGEAFTCNNVDNDDIMKAIEYIMKEPESE